MSKNQTIVLEEIQSQIEKILLSKNNLDEEDYEDYCAIKRMIDLKLNNQEIRNVFKSYQDYLQELATTLDLSKRLPMDDEKDLFSFLAFSLNFLSDELETRTIPVEFLEKLMEFVMEVKPDFALLTTFEGQIIYVANNSQSVVGYSKNKLIRRKIQSFFATNVHFEFSSGDFFKNKEVRIINADSVIIPVYLTVEEIFHPHRQQDQPYYLYMFKEKPI